MTVESSKYSRKQFLYVRTFFLYNFARLKCRENEVLVKKIIFRVSITVQENNNAI